MPFDGSEVARPPTIEEMRAWLDSLDPATDHAGLVGDAARCPIACCIGNLFGVPVGTRSVQVYGAGIRIRNRVYRSPAWALRFMALVDAAASEHTVSVARARECLASAEVPP